MKQIKDGTIKQAHEIDWTNDWFKRGPDTHPGYFVYFGMWKGPFRTAEEAKDAWKEWRWEMMYS
jgi:hypothetical protein